MSVLDADISISGGTSGGDGYEGGWLEFSLATASANDFLRFSDDGSASVTNGVVSIVNSVLYVGNGTGAAILGNVDSAKNGLAGSSLKINLSNAFQNGNFETNDGTSAFGNWQIQSGPIYFGTTQIGGLNTPTDTTAPAAGVPISDQNVPTQAGSYSAAVNDDGGGENSVRLTSGSPTTVITASGRDIVRGPALYSNNTVYLRANDQVSFDWKASGGSDAYDVFGYIVNVDNNAFVEILNATGSSASATTSWATESVTVTNPGSYRFVFVAGTYDFSGGTWAGAQLYVDNVTVTENVAAPAISDRMMEAIARKIKYENTSDDPPLTKTLTVKATSINGSSGSEQTGTANATINFTRANDAPTITSGTSAAVDENLSASTVIYATTATDFDSSDTLTFSISGTDSSLLSVDADDGEIRLNASADFETKTSYSFNIIVTDNGAGTLSDTKAVVISINDINDAPIITSGATGAVAENASAASTVIYDASASDTDVSDSITFSVSGTDASLITIDSDDGEIRLKNSANFENKASYSFVVTATDNASSSASGSKSVTVNVSDINDAPVAVDDNATTTIDTAINGIVVLNDDTDEDGDTLSIQSIIYSGTGAASHNGSVINYTPPAGVATTTETITYTVSDGNGAVDTGILTVAVVTPLITGPSGGAGSTTSAISKQENQTVVNTFTANITVSWSLEAGLDSNKFSIDGGGNLTFNSAPNFEFPSDLDGNNTYLVEVKASEGRGYFSSQILTVNIINVNEAAPVIDTSSLTGSVLENASTTTVIYDVQATDADATDTLTYSVSGADSSSVSIDADDGEIRLNTSSDFETKNSYSFDVTVTDPDGTNDTESVNVNVIDENESPVVTSASTVSLAENLVTSTVAYTVVATDVDGDNISFSVSGTDSPYVTVDADDGEIRLKSTADFETKASYSFNAVGTDDGTGALSGTKAVVINITNSNDDPMATNSVTNWGITEDEVSSLSLGLLFFDPDDDPLTFTARLAGGAALPAWISYNSLTTVLSASPTRLELRDSWSSGNKILEIVANDGNGGQVTTQLPITINPLNHPATGNVTLEGSGLVNEKLTMTSSISDLEGLGTFNYKWLRGGTEIIGELKQDYLVSSRDIGFQLSGRISFIDGFGFSESIISVPGVDVVIPTYTLNKKDSTFKDAFSQIVIKGSPNNDVLVAVGGNSSVDGGAGSDVIIGGTGSNPLNGNTGNDFIIGDLLLSEYFFGDDILVSGAGDDLIEGGNGSDTFIFSPNDGNDTIAKFRLDLNNLTESKPIAKDFQIGEDKIDLTSFVYGSYEEVLDKISSTVEGYARFSDQGSNILLFGVTLDELSSQDFIF